MHWNTLNKKKETVAIKSDEVFESYSKWKFAQPVKRTLAGRNDRGRNIMYLRGKIGGSIPRPRQVLAAFKKGWYAHEQQMD